MSIAPPKRGSVIRCAYLWADEDQRRRGRNFVYGEIPQTLLKRVVDSYLANANAARTEVVVRSS